MCIPFLAGAETGLSGVPMMLAEYSQSNPYNASVGSRPIPTVPVTTPLNTQQPLQPGDFYTILEGTLPASYSQYTSTTGTLGSFVNSTGATLTAPANWLGLPSTGLIANNEVMYMVTFPSTTAAGFGDSGGYSAVNYDFGQVPSPSLINIGQPPGTILPALTASLAVVGTNDRFLAGGWQQSERKRQREEYAAIAGASNLNWQVASASAGLNVSPTSGTNLAPGQFADHHGNNQRHQLRQCPGLQNATLSISGVSSTGKQLTRAPRAWRSIRS